MSPQTTEHVCPRIAAWLIPFVVAAIARGDEPRFDPIRPSEAARLINGEVPAGLSTSLRASSCSSPRSSCTR